jgi:hypothetical protein
MGVKYCDRANCDNIMCHRYSDIYGYICYECFDELVSTGPATNIKQFMSTPKQEVNLDAAKARYEIEFPED